MALQVPNIGDLFPLIDTDVTATLHVDGKDYELSEFHVSFNQEIDHKGKPQHETHGGQIRVAMTQGVGDNIYDWAKRPDRIKDGTVNFKTPTSGTILAVDFTNGYCVRLERNVNSSGGTLSSLVIAAEKVSLNGVTHDNNWRL